MERPFPAQGWMGNSRLPVELREMVMMDKCAHGLGRFLLLAGVILLYSFSASCSGGPDPRVVRIGLISPPTLLEPAKIKSQAELLVAGQVFEGLVDIDTATQSVLPCLAREWTLSPDGLEYRFTLEPATWTDGNPVSAQDVRESWLRMLDPSLKSAFGWIPARYIQGAAAYYSADPASTDKARLASLREQVAIKVEAPLVVSLRLTRPDSRFLWALAHGAFWVLPARALARIDREGLHASGFIGCGPFLPEAAGDNRLRLKANQLWRKAATLIVNELDFTSYPTVPDLVAAWKNRLLDHAPFLPREAWQSLHDLEDLQVGPVSASYYYVFNLRSAPLRDPRVRQALSLAVPVRELVEKLINRGLYPAGGILPAVGGLQGLPPVTPDAVRARSLLAEAGYDGKKKLLTLDLVYNKNESNILVAEYLADVWKRELGVQVKLEGLEMKDYLLRQEKGDFQVLRSGWQELVLDPLAFLERFTGSSVMNDAGYRNPAFDSLVTSLRALHPGDWAANLSRLREGEKMLLDDHIVLPLFQYTQPSLLAQGIWSNLTTDALDHYRYSRLQAAVK